MEEQFGGRTDDALFYDDDFEPVVEESKPLYETVPEPVVPIPEQVVAPAAAPPPATHEPPAPELAPPKALAQSRHATRSPRPKPKARNHSPKDAPPKDPAPTAPAPAAAPAAAPTAPAQSTNPDARLASGANPRTKLTEDELTAKMSRMRILAAEQARKFEVAERDERRHAAAYARDMEEAKKRRAIEAEKRKRGEEERRRMEDERARNRERKLKAMGREGNWDEGKEEVPEGERRTFRGANGGVKGVRGGGLAGSRFADEPPARGRGNRGRGGRGGRRDENGEMRKQAAPSITPDHFPALPTEAHKEPKEPAKPEPAKADKPKEGAYTAALTKGVKAGSLETGGIAPADSLPGSPPVGRWDDEMEAADERERKG